jgi:hypothetical protein
MRLQRARALQLISLDSMHRESISDLAAYSDARSTLAAKKVQSTFSDPIKWHFRGIIYKDENPMSALLAGYYFLCFDGMGGHTATIQ